VFRIKISFLQIADGGLTKLRNEQDDNPEFCQSEFPVEAGETQTAGPPGDRHFHSRKKLPLLS